MQQLTDIELKWFNQIQEARSSGLSDYEWCRQNNVATSTFYYHIHKLRDKAADLPANRSTIVPETHEVVKIELCEGDQLLMSPSFEEEPAAAHIAPTLDTSSKTLTKSDFSTRLQMGSITVDFSNSACERIILSVINALRQPC